MDIRMAGEDDLPAILAIYNDAVLHTTAIWNDDTVDLDNRRAWFAARRGQGYPVFVATEGDRVLGYASYGDFRPFQGYRFTVENSVYVASSARGNGAGAALLAALVADATAADKHVMIAAITAGNEASVRLHARQGFVATGRLGEVGFKFGAYLDLILMEKRLAAPSSPTP
ncbi:N-acetyltransferase family protein [Mesorhizobium sp. BR1-1-16]|uniref:GNAT family N-acetyltransferase n=1 Tax=Mesorhizobium sp. BR1-1-16 TaxID=2876653 RepID=UPI001CD02C06|nr:GNAT family N-acetyltransferase [Mesorhizobium sp. BR1-1-16]MBZ9937138.1 N-acetyltransferase family protein [Mesorhizobium sp. BR1-1-16]